MTLNLTMLTDGQTRSDPDTLSPLDLAFMGDTVFDLLVREELLADGSRPVKTLHALAVKRVRAQAQAAASEVLKPYLTEEEADVFRRGRNTKVNGIPKNATAGEYHAATGIEALFGWLYLKGRGERLAELYSIISREAAKNEAD